MIMNMKAIASFSFALLLAGILLSCGKEEAAKDPYDINYVYIQQSQAYDHTILYKEGGEFVKPIVPSEKLVRVRCTKPAPADITVSFAPDQQYVDAYNETHKTAYKLLSKVKVSSLTIRKGEYVSADSLQVTYEDPSEFLGGKDFMLPLSISEVKGEDVAQSVKFKTVMLTYQSVQLHFQVQDFQAEVGKRLEDISDWKIFVDGSETNQSGYTWISWLTDKSNYTAALYQEEATFDIDMQKDFRIASFALEAISLDRAPKRIRVQKISKVGEDAEILADFGEVTVPDDIYKDAIDETHFTIHRDIHVNFFKPVEARCLRVITSGRLSSESWYSPGFSEFWFYEE